MVKMLLTGYLYGIGSERRLVQEIQLNIAYWMEVERNVTKTMHRNLDVLMMSWLLSRVL